ncbi:hypothetical protein MMC31_000796 [Peltigera leucophlebia]|nr:hypothetical protein [Peltigera leucophlebia]
MPSIRGLHRVLFTKSHPPRDIHRETSIESHISSVIHQDSSIEIHASRFMHRDSSTEIHASRFMHREPSIESHPSSPETKGPTSHSDNGRFHRYDEASNTDVKTANEMAREDRSQGGQSTELGKIRIIRSTNFKAGIETAR